jgi:hypothetical protein
MCAALPPLLSPRLALAGFFHRHRMNYVLTAVLYICAPTIPTACLPTVQIIYIYMFIYKHAYRRAAAAPHTATASKPPWSWSCIIGTAALLGAAVPWALAEVEAEVRLALGVERAEVADMLLLDAAEAEAAEAVDKVVDMDMDSESEADDAEDAETEAAVLVAAAMVAVLVAPWT